MPSCVITGHRMLLVIGENGKLGWWGGRMKGDFSLLSGTLTRCIPHCSIWFQVPLVCRILNSLLYINHCSSHYFSGDVYQVNVWRAARDHWNDRKRRFCSLWSFSWFFCLHKLNVTTVLLGILHGQSILGFASFVSVRQEQETFVANCASLFSLSLVIFHMKYSKFHK